MPRKSKILIRNGTTTPNAVDFDTAEPAWDKTAGKLYIKDGAGSMVEVGGGGGGGGLTHFVESEETASPNDVTPVDALTATDASYTNIDVALVAKGSGATLAQVPDGTTTGGSKRGQYATDWQKIRSASSQVASGNYSVIAGGQNNTASSSYSFVGGGQGNEAKTNTHATCVGGINNDTTGKYSFAGGGRNNIASNYADVALGENATASGSNSAVLGGYLNVASASGAVVVGGLYNTANATCSTVIGSKGLTRGIRGSIVLAAREDTLLASKQGAAQTALLLLARETTNATATVLTSNTFAASTTNQVILPNNSAYYFKGSVISGVTGGGDSKAWTFEGAIKRGATAATTAIVGSVVLNTIAEDAGASAWSVAITADTTNGGIKVEVTGAAATTIRWVCKIETTEMTY